MKHSITNEPTTNAKRVLSITSLGIVVNYEETLVDDKDEVIFEGKVKQHNLGQSPFGYQEVKEEDKAKIDDFLLKVEQLYASTFYPTGTTSTKK
jgi:hypothetical protein